MAPKKPLRFTPKVKEESVETVTEVTEETDVQTPAEAVKAADTGEQEVDIEELPGGGTRETVRKSRRYS